MRSLQIYKIFFLLAPFFFFLCISGNAQSKVCKSVSVNGLVNCGAESVKFKNITSNKLAGIVESRIGLPIFVEVYKIDKKNMKVDFAELVDVKEPFMTIQTNDAGEFCHSGLSDGYYLIRFGTPYGDWNCSWIRVHILRGGSFRKVKVELTLGI